MIDLNDLERKAELIRTNSTPNSNTPALVGGAIKDLVAFGKVMNTEEGKRANAENAREQAELERSAAERQRQQAELLRSNAENARDNAERDRALEENIRENQESGRSLAENTRSAAEQTRLQSEIERANAESLRVSAEIGRSQEEILRNSAERERSLAESDRKTAELLRESAEEERARAENEREEQMGELVKEVRESISVDDVQTFAWQTVNEACADGPGTPPTGYYSVPFSMGIGDTVQITNVNIYDAWRGLGIIKIVDGNPVFPAEMVKKFVNNGDPGTFAIYAVDSGDYDSSRLNGEYTLGTRKNLIDAIKHSEEFEREVSKKIDDVQTSLDGKQETLVSGQTVKTVNGQSILGSGNIEIEGGGGYAPPSAGIPKSDLSADVQSSLGKADTALQQHQQIKTVNGQSIVGSGDITIVGEQGPKGDTGDVGPKGDTGATGPQGPKGVTDDEYEMLMRAGDAVDTCNLLAGRDTIPEFSTEAAYKENDLVLHDGILYRCTQDRAAGPWRDVSFVQSSLYDEIVDMRGKDRIESVFLKLDVNKGDAVVFGKKVYVYIENNDTPIVHTVPENNLVVFSLPFGLNYHIVFESIDGYRDIEALNLYSNMKTRFLSCTYKLITNGLSVVCYDGTEVNIDDWDETENEKAFGLKISTTNLITNNAEFVIPKFFKGVDSLTMANSTFNVTGMFMSSNKDAAIGNFEGEYNTRLYEIYINSSDSISSAVFNKLNDLIVEIGGVNRKPYILSIGQLLEWFSNMELINDAVFKIGGNNRISASTRRGSITKFDATRFWNINGALALGQFSMQWDYSYFSYAYNI